MGRDDIWEVCRGIAVHCTLPHVRNVQGDTILSSSIVCVSVCVCVCVCVCLCVTKYDL